MVTSLFGGGRDYRKLGHSRLTWLGSVRLWEGPDHFLQTDLIFAYEYYKRFYYKDIRAFTLSASRRGEYWHFVLGALTTVLCGFAIYSSWRAPSLGFLQWTLIIFAAIMALIWSIHFLLGPTCVCHVVTPVQKERLASLSRVRNARATLDLLAVRVMAAQSELPPLSVDLVLAPSIVELVQPAEPTAAAARPGPPRTVSVILFALCLVVAGGLFSMLIWQGPALRVATVIGVLGGMALAISCLATRRVTGAAVPLTWMLVISDFALFFGWYFWAIFDVMQVGKSVPAMEVEYLKMFLNASTRDSLFLRWSILTAGAVNAVCGALGLALTVPKRARAAAPLSETPAEPEGK